MSLLWAVLCIRSTDSLLLNQAPELVFSAQGGLSSRLLGILKNDSDANPDMAEYLIEELGRRDCLLEFEKLLSSSKPPYARMTSPTSKALWALSKKEEVNNGKDLNNLSLFGTYTPKYPRSWVEKIMKLNSTKNHRYMFSGSVYAWDNLPKHNHRQWLNPFVKDKFTNADYFRATDAPESYTPLGDYDHSLQFEGYRPKSHDNAYRFDNSYWAAMKQSKFVMTPGGDGSWSFRFFESFLTESLPIINSMNEDYGDTHDTVHLKEVPYEYGWTANYPHTYDKAVIDRNLKRFIRYQTFMEGDNDPVQDSKKGFQIN